MFEIFLRDRLNDLANLKVKLQKLPNELPLTEVKVDFLSVDPLAKVVGASEAPGSSSIATYESVTFNLKMIADTLGIDNKEFMVL